MECLNLLSIVSLHGISAFVSPLDLRKQVHRLIIKAEVLLDLKVGTSLTDVYLKCCVDDSRVMLNTKELVVWNAMAFGDA